MAEFLTIQFTGLAELALLLEAAPHKIEEAAEIAALIAFDVIKADLAIYPSPPANSKRTGNLAAGWEQAVPTLKPLTSGFEMSIDNGLAPYWIWVQAAERQRTFNVGKWRTDEQILDTHQSEIEALLGREVGNALLEI